MTFAPQLTSLRASLINFLLRYWLPSGWFALLTGMFWIGDRALYHKLYYVSLAFPTFVLLLLQPRWLLLLKRVAISNLFLLFASYMLLSLLWSPADVSLFSMVKRPLYIVLAFAAAALLASNPSPRLAQSTEWAAWAAVVAAVATIAYYLHEGDGGRLSGYGALYNALKSTHVFGFFAVYWLCRWYQHPSPKAWGPIAALIPLWLLLLLTGSRTPLLAVAAALLWLALLQWRQRAWLIIAAGLSAAISWQLLQPAETLLTRGLSYRPAIWAEALRQLEGNFWFGLGLEHPQVFQVTGLDEALADTHNTPLGVLFEGGVAGLALWLLMYAYALGYAWTQRRRRDVAAASALVVFGLVAGFTEGSGFFSRPNEHWFLLWIPLALLAATQQQAARQNP